MNREDRFRLLADEVWAPLQRYLRRRTTDADDVLSEVLAVLWRRLDDVPEDAALPWAYGVAERCLANAERASRRRLTLVRRLAGEPVAPAPDPDPVLGEALARLGPADQQVLRLWAWEQLAPREIAVALGITPGAASTRLHRATARLRDELGKDPAGAGQVQGRQEQEARR